MQNFPQCEWMTEDAGRVKVCKFIRVGGESCWTFHIQRLPEAKFLPQYPIMIHLLFTCRKDCLLLCFKAKFYLYDDKNRVPLYMKLNEIDIWSVDILKRIWKLEWRKCCWEEKCQKYQSDPTVKKIFLKCKFTYIFFSC